MSSEVGALSKVYLLAVVVYLPTLPQPTTRYILI